jgi:D-erythrulose 1-phosphate 3-epimerase
VAEIVFGVNNGFALKNWPEPMAWARIISEELGLKHVQFSFDLLDPTLPNPVMGALCDEVTEAVRTFGLIVDSTFTGLVAYAQNMMAHPNAVVRTHAFNWYQAALQATARMSAFGTGGHIGALSAADYANPERRALIHSTVIGSVRDLARLASGLEQKYLLWEMMPTPRELPHTPEVAIDLMQEMDQGTAVPVQLCFDLGHCSAFDHAPGDPYAWLERVLPWTRVVHLQQTDGKADRHWPFTAEYDQVGIIDPARVIEIVRQSPLERVDLFLEIGHALDAPDDKIIDDHKKSVDAWARHLE